MVLEKRVIPTKEMNENVELKFNDKIKVNPRIPEEYYELYGDCAPSKFKKDLREGKIKKAYEKSSFFGKFVEKYFRIFHNYRTEEELMGEVFDSMKSYLRKDIF